MTLKAKKKFFHHNWVWCRLHGIHFDDLKKINGNFVRYSKKCDIKKIKLFGGYFYAGIN